MNQTTLFNCRPVIAALSLSGAMGSFGLTVFTDSFEYDNANAFIAEGGWTTLIDIDADPGTGLGAGEGFLWGNGNGGESALEFEYPTALNANEVISIDASVRRPNAGYQYGMRIILWDGADITTRTEVAGGSVEGNTATAGVLPPVTYSVTAADLTAGRDHVIFKYGHDVNWGETDVVTFAVTPPLDGSIWTNVAGGSWATGGNWTPAGPAGGADQAAFFNTLDITDARTVTLDGNYTIGSLVFSDLAGEDGSWTLATGTGGPLTLSAPLQGTPKIDVTNRTATVTTVLTGTEGMAKTGAGTLVLDAVNTYTGGTTIQAGTVILGNANAIPSGAGAGDLTLGGTLDLNDLDLTLNGLSGGGAVTNSGDGEVTLTIGDDNAESLTFSGSIGDGTGATDLVKMGTGLQTLTGAHGLSGMISANAGTLVIGGAASNLQNVAGIVVNPGATVRLAAINHFVPDHGTALDPARVLAVNEGSLVMTETIETRVGNVDLSNGATWTVNRGTAAWDVLLADTTAGPAAITVANTAGNTDASALDGEGGIHLQGVQTFNIDDVSGNADSDLEISIRLGNPGNVGGADGGINKLGTGTLLLSGDNNYRADTLVAEGNVILAEGGALAFGIRANGIANKVTGPGSSTLNGAFTIDTSAADNTSGNTWTLVDIKNNTYGETFSVTGFTAEARVHTLVDGVNTWIFSEATGMLSVVNDEDYGNWAITNNYWTPGAPNTGLADDFDNDGLTNEEEWAFGLNPTSGSSVNAITATPNTVSNGFTYTRRNPELTGLTLAYEWSVSMAPGSWQEFVPANAAVVSEGDNQTVNVSLAGTDANPATKPKLFVRVIIK